MTIQLRYALLLAVLYGSQTIWAQEASQNGTDCLSPLGDLSPNCQAAADTQSGDDQTSPPNTPPRSIHTAIPTLRTDPRSSRPRPDGSYPRDTQPLMDDRDSPLTDFQRFAMRSVGGILPIFGADLFKQVPTTFAPVDRVPVTTDYLIGPGDELMVRLWGQVNADLQLTVDRAGGVFIPRVGNISVAGLPFGKLPSYLRAQIGRTFRNFDLDVSIGQLRSIQVFVVGQARRPGNYTISALSTLLNAVFASGGPLPQGSMRHIQLKRGAEVIGEFDLYDLLLKGDKSKDLRLMPGDVIYIPPAGAQLAVAGSVRNPAVYELNGETNVASVIQMAGGPAPTADWQRATLERIDQHSARKTINLTLNGNASSTDVADGDIIHIPAINPIFQNAVTLRGNVANPGRFPWRQGMHLRDLIPDKQSLISRHYSEQRNALGDQPVNESTKQKNQDEVLARQKKRDQDAGLLKDSVPNDNKREVTTLGVTEPDINWSYAVIERQKDRDLSTELIPFNLGRLVIEGDDSQNLELRPSDVVTIFSQSDIRVATAQQNQTVRLEGEFVASGLYTVHPGETLGQLIQRAGGFTPQAYLYASQFLRESTRIAQQHRLEDFARNLEDQLQKESATRAGNAASTEEAAVIAKRVDTERQMIENLRNLKATGRIVLNLDPDKNDPSKLMSLSLEDGDQFIVPPKPSTVNILGAVYNQNSFFYEQQKSVGDYLRQAGGPTRSADKDHLFVIRADGSVSPKSGFNPFTRSFEASRLSPGDSVVMPEALFRTSFLKGLRDWSQVFGQLALGAAAINVLK